MIQAQTQTAAYWGQDFSVTEADVEHIYNHFLEVEQPQTLEQIIQIIMSHRVSEETNQIERRLAGKAIYQPRDSYAVGDELVFPVLKFAHGTVEEVREGHNPQLGTFNVIRVAMNGKQREFAADLAIDHELNLNEDSELVSDVKNVDLDDLTGQYGHLISEKVSAALNGQDEFIRLGKEWFVHSLMSEVNIGHMHLAEAVLEMSEGGPLPPEEILVHLDMDPSIHQSVHRFSLNYGLLKDGRFDEIAPRGQVLWFLNRLEPDGVKETPERLRYESIAYDRALLSPQLLMLERELDDEWSDLQPASHLQSALLSLTYPHRLSGTLPLNSSTRPLFPPSQSPRQRIVFINEETQDEIVGWVVQEQRYIYGFQSWFEETGIPIGGFIHLKPGPEPGVVILGYDKRRARREWVRLATAQNNRIQFELNRRAVAAGYDDLLIVGTDVVAAIDTLWKRVNSNHRNVASLLAELFPDLSALNPQNTVHAKTLYSALNMLKRVPPGPIFAELVRNPAFQPVGDHYWRFDRSKWQANN
ncbi:MAG: hypothetical protein AAF614_38335 [Chloroflexota bacterium]